MTMLSEDAERYFDRIETGTAWDDSQEDFYVWALDPYAGVAMRWFGGEYADICVPDDYGLPGEAFDVANMFSAPDTRQGPFDEYELRTELANTIADGLV